MTFEFTIYKPYNNDVTNPYEKLKVEADSEVNAHTKVVSKVKSFLKHGDNSWVDAKILNCKVG